MKKAARKIYNILRLAIVTALVSIVGVFAIAYVALSIPAVQDKIKEVGEEELSNLLHTDVKIGEVTIMPFNEVVLKDVEVPDQKGDSLFTIEKLGAGVSLYNLVVNQRIVFTYAEIVGLKGHIVKPDRESPTNMQFIIDAFKPKDNKPPKKFDLVIYNVVLRKCALTYDLLSEARKEGQFDPNHVALDSIKADLTLPRLKNDDFIIELNRMSLVEQSGFKLKNIAAKVEINNKMTVARGLIVELPNSLLSLGDIELHYNSLKTMGNDIKNSPVEVALSNSYIALEDISPFVPKLKGMKDVVDISAIIKGDANHVDVRTLALNTHDNLLSLNTSATIDSLSSKENISFDVPHIVLHAHADKVEDIVSRFASLTPQAAGIIRRCGDVSIDGSAKGNIHNLHFNGGVGTSLGALNLNGQFVSNDANKSFSGHIATLGFGLGELLAKTNLLGEVAMDVDLTGQLGAGKLSNASINGVISYIDFNGYRYHNITADLKNELKDVNGSISVDDPSVKLNIEGVAHLDGPATTIDIDLNTDGLNMSRLGFIKNVPDGQVSMVMSSNFSGNSLDNLTGSIVVDDVNYSDGNGKKLHLNNVTLTADNASMPQNITLNSDFLNGNVTGSYDFSTLVPSVKGMLSTAFPKLFGNYAYVLKRASKKNDLDFNFVLDPSDELNDILKLPVKFVYKTTVNGNISESHNSFAVNVNAPYLLNGNKIIEGTDLSARLDNEAGNVSVVAHTLFPLKQGKAAVTLNANGINDRLDADLAWRVARETDFHGNLNMSSFFDRDEDGKMIIDIDVNPSQLVFNDKPWQVDPAKVSVHDGVIKVDNLCGHSDDQFVKINGEASKNPESELCLELNDISLDYVFETLNINHVTFGGQATGKFYASDLFSKAPRIYTPVLHVAGLSYNEALMGDTDIKSRWLNDEKAVELDADIAQTNGLHSRIKGAIFAADDSLYLDFDAQRANVGFLKPYMSAFTSDVQGEVSGNAILFGNFKTINLKGDIKADSLKFKLDYTNVYYTCSGDSVHMKPDLITFSDVMIHDREGHEAKLNGWLKHNSFHDPVFNFSITEAKNFLCYDTNADINPIWYGQVYGNGSAFVTGEPGVVDIKVNMQSSPNSKFTFVLSDAEEANEYNFITFRDRNKPVGEIKVEEVVDTIPEIVRQLSAKANIEQQGPPTSYNIDLQGDITPDLQLIVVMDPVGGDRIKATGRGNLRLTYNNNDEMTMFGKYTLEKGNYNFTLQDVIIKDFTIKDGSSISFQGDPYAALLDIKAVYALNANIKDLDETFADDKEINRTNVPVHALLNAKGLISQPDISFDLEFPTLTTDAYRRIKSIISTDEMMNRQIIYLLALNRFYTPEYMNNSRPNNELTSVASSTISSQLSNMLGKMSDKWSISPNFRTSRGDFSDVEVDLALSSQLLNNRLLFNGNFGYRDNKYNTRNSNFIGDFDIEYLLNKNGSFRLKAYNHFNDQNFYVRNALTTQGVGIVWKHDFDRPFDFLNKNRYKLNIVKDTTVTDTVKVVDVK
ncbi:translocation/assembly module TamB domain-containing protein [Sodaliphilus sp.]|uniref:translocation/assembly module TamB domain-containing protein n=1 Tax=Sodaliphilus sp. TaxID=2815818 RepID=UPI003890DC11